MNELLLQAVAPANLATRVPESGRRAGLGRLGGAPDISLFSEDDDMSSSGSRPRPSQYPVTGPRVSEVPTCAAAHRFLFLFFSSTSYLQWKQPSAGNHGKIGCTSSFSNESSLHVVRNL